MFTDFYKAFNYLANHHIFQDRTLGEHLPVSKFLKCLQIDVVKVNPHTKAIDNDASLNTKTEVWLEVGPYLKTKQLAHDVDLDCGGDTFEEAILELATLVRKNYTDDKETALSKVAEYYY